MTITTAKRIAARVPQLAPLAAALMLALPAQAQWKVTPSLTLGQTYTDNVGLQSDANKRSDWVTEATPGIAAYGRNSRVQLSARASASFYKYASGEPVGTRSNNSQYSASGRVKVIDELLYVDASAQGGRRSLSAFGLRQDSGNRFADENSTDVASWSISPYLTRRFGNFAVASLRYTHEQVNADDMRFGNSSTDSALFTLGSGRAWRDVGWNLRYARQDLQTDRFGDTTSENALLGLNYSVHRTLKLTATGGYDSYDYQALGGRTAGASWSAGFAWAPSARTAVDMSVGRHFLGNTGSLLASHRSRHTVWRLSYSDGVTNSRQEFAQALTIDTATVIDALFSPTIADPFARRQAVQDYLLASGLPLSTTQNVNYLTNRFFRQKQALASFAFNKRAHSTLISAFVNERLALSTGEADAGLLGSELFALNNNVRQFGASAAHSYRINALTSATATLTATRNRSLTTSFETDQQSLRLAMTRRFSRKLLGNVELRRARGDRGLFGAGYTENAISATLSAQL
ncbi:TIGR03016 family PEP-CTERM system-associated outer membrane protein [Massilia sp. CMS3.1]|uniref:TIGR03016 family PEP-CTERM system-associated outer membrane protein n=1 Tax=Massilia sp. CMS3.1 TaxID=3373083 RepID=UPI003EE74158